MFYMWSVFFFFFFFGGGGGGGGGGAFDPILCMYSSYLPVIDNVLFYFVIYISPFFYRCPGSSCSNAIATSLFNETET